MPSYSAHDTQLIDALVRRGKVFVARPEDDEWLLSITPRPDLLMSQAVRRGSLLPLGGGRYVPREPDVELVEETVPMPLLVSARVFPQPCALGYRSALRHYGLVDDRTPEDLSAYPWTFAVRGLEGVRLSRLAEQPVKLVRVDKERFFGHTTAQWEGEPPLRLKGDYQVTDLERTLVDCLDKPRLCGTPTEIAKIWGRAFKGQAYAPDAEGVARYAMELGHSTARRAAFWLDKVGERSWANAIMTSERVHEENLAQRHLLPGRSQRGRQSEGPRQLAHPVLLDSTKAHAIGSAEHVDLTFGIVVNLPDRVIQLAQTR